MQFCMIKQSIWTESERFCYPVEVRLKHINNYNLRESNVGYSLLPINRLELDKTQPKLNFSLLDYDSRKNFKGFMFYEN